jgi:hypothetical protein
MVPEEQHAEDWQGENHVELNPTLYAESATLNPILQAGQSTEPLGQPLGQLMGQQLPPQKQSTR